MIKLELDTTLVSAVCAAFLAVSCAGGDFKSGGRKGAAEKTDASLVGKYGAGKDGAGKEQAAKDDGLAKDDGAAKDGEDGEDGEDGAGQDDGDDGKNDGGDAAAIGKCLAKWGQHPFGAQPQFRKISAAVQVFGKGKGIVDDQKTSQTALILITAAVNVLGESTYELLNPNGWYCLKVDVNVKAKTTINLHCDAKLADSKVDVSVGSSSQPAGVVGVHVLSDVKIARVGGSCD